MFAKIIDYLKYPTTWQGLITLLTLAGVNIAPEQATAIITAGVAVVAAVSVFFSDTDVKK